MAQNIFGYQGINTPLASLTRGRYNVADYTQLREQFNARITALEKKQSSQQNEIISGYLQIIASSTQTGYLNVAGTGSFGGTLQSASTLSSLGGLSIAQNAAITGNCTIGGLVEVGASGIQFDDGSVQTTAPQSIPALFVNILFYDQTPGQNITPGVSLNKQTEIVFNYTNSCTLNLLNLQSDDTNAFPDGIRYVSVTKGDVAVTDYTVTILCPGFGGAQPYNFYTPSGADVSSYSLNVGKYGVTFMIATFGLNRRTYMKSLIN
jgi:hypothetical protein